MIRAVRGVGGYAPGALSHAVRFVEGAAVARGADPLRGAGLVDAEALGKNRCGESAGEG